MFPIYIATKCIQKRKHRKKRINKKWQKRYGYYEINYMPHNEIITIDNGVIWMTKRTFEELKRGGLIHDYITCGDNHIRTSLSNLGIS